MSTLYNPKMDPMIALLKRMWTVLYFFTFFIHFFHLSVVSSVLFLILKVCVCTFQWTLEYPQRL
jgi:hypothetical protein